MILFQKRVGIIDPKNNAEWFNRKENAKPPFGLRCAVEHANQNNLYQHMEQQKVSNASTAMQSESNCPQEVPSGM